MAWRLSERLRRLLPTSMQTRRFDAAAGGRRWQGTPTFGHINSEIAAAAGPVRRRAAYFARNSAWLTSGISALVAGAIGCGIKPQSQARDPGVREALHRAWTRWNSEADSDGVTDFYGLQALAVRALIEAGECFAQLIPTSAGLRLRLLDSDMCPLDETRELSNGRRIIQGIELADDGTRLAYWVHRTRPDVPSFSTELVRVPAEQMAHLYCVLSPGQLRGISWLAPILLRVHEADILEDASLVKAKISALLCGFITDPNGTGLFDGTKTAPGVLETGLTPGELRTLPPGADIRFSDPPAIGDTIPFLQLQLRAIAAGLGVPAYMLDGDLSQANYSSLRAGLNAFRSKLEPLQHSVIVHQLLRPIWCAWITTEVLAGRLVGDLDELLSVEWIAPAQPSVDPQKDAEAARLQLAAGLTSRRRELASVGWDIERVDAEIASDAERAHALGLQFETTDTPKAATPLRMVPNAA